MGRKGKSNHRRNEALRRSRREPVSRQPHMQTSGRGRDIEEDPEDFGGEEGFLELLWY